MKKLLVFLAAFLLLSSFAFATGGTDDDATQEFPEIFVWGVPAWAGNYTPEMLAKGNEWAKEMFGCTFTIKSLPSGAEHIQGLNLLMAQGEFPDVMLMGGGTPAARRFIGKLYDEGKLAALDKYFDMPKELPNLAKADKDYLKGYSYKGKIISFPGYNCSLDKTAPPWVGYVWCMRFDIAKDNKDSLPTTSTELYQLLKKIKGNYVDADGKPIIPLGIQEDQSMGALTNFLKQLKGAGWQSDSKGRYIPDWASVEMYESLKYVNRLWNEGLMDPGYWTLNNEKFQESLRKCRYGIDVGNTWNVSISWSQMINTVKTSGLDSEEAKAYRETLYVAALSPVRNEDVRPPIHNVIASPTVVSSAIDPMPVMRFFNYIHSDEGLIGYQMDQGKLGVDWEFTDKPLNWRKIGTVDSQETAAEDKRGAWIASDKIDLDNPPTVVPVLMYLSSPSYSSYYTRLYSKRNLPGEYFSMYGLPRGLEEDFGFTVDNTSHDYGMKKKDYVTPTPSYKLFIPELDPLESAAITSMEQRWREGLPKVIASDNFENDYKDFIASIIKVGNLKPIYDRMHNQWEAWMKDNGDDRNRLEKVTVIPEWKEVMGW